MTTPLSKSRRIGRISDPGCKTIPSVFRTERAIEIEASSTRIWPYLTEPELLKRWIRELSSIELVSGRTLHTGARGRVMVHSATIECELLEYDPPREMTAGFWREGIDTPALLGIRLEPVGHARD